MKKCKKLLSSILALTIIATLFSGVGNIFSGAETFEELKRTINLEAYDSQTAAEELEKDWAPGGTNSLISINANPDHSVAGDGNNLYADYKLEMNSPKNYAYAKEDGKYYVDWKKNTVTSVSYTVLPCAYFAKNANFDYCLNIPLGNGQTIQYGFRSDQGCLQFRAASFQTQLRLWLSSTLKYYAKDTLITHNNISELLEVSSAEIANEITITINYTKKEDGSYILKNIVAVIDPEIKISNVEGVTATSVTADNTVTITPKSGQELVITDPQFCLPSSGYFNSKDQNAFYNYTYIKDASITYYENQDNYITDFVTSYENIKDLTVDTVTDTNKADIIECYNIYNGYDSTKKSYVGTARYEHVLALYTKVMESQLLEEVAEFTAAYNAVKDLTVDTVTASDKDRLEALVTLYNSYDADHQNVIKDEYTHVYELYSKAEYLDTSDRVKTAALNKGQLSNITASEQMWQYTCLQDYGRYVYSPTSAHTNNTYNRFFNLSDVGGFGFEFDGVTATQNITGKIYKPAGTAENDSMLGQTSCFINYVKKDFVPEDVSNISATVSLHPGSYNIFFGENANSAVADYKNFKYNDGTSQENDFPRYGLRISVNNDGTVSAGYAYITIKDATESTNSYYTGKYITNIGYNNNVDALAYSKKIGSKLDMTAEKLTISLDLSHKYKYPSGTTTLNYIQPVITLKDSNGNVISQASDVDGSGNEPYLGKTPHSSCILAFPTDVTGFAISSYNSTYDAQDTTGTNGNVSKPYTDTLKLYDFDIVGAATPNTYGASIKKTNEVEKQDIRFAISFGKENSYLISNGYSVKSYGAIVAINNALEDGDSLTLTSVYKEQYRSTLGAPKKIEQEGSLPQNSIYVNIGNSANDPAILGLVYRVRPYVVYAKEGTEDIVIYSEDSSASKAYTPRSIFSTAKLIAKDIIAKSAFVNNDTYEVNGTPISYSDILAVINGTNTGKSTAKFTDTDITLGQGIIAFTSAHQDLIG